MPDQPAEAASVAVKLPDFWRSDPTMWFAQAEAQFALANVVQDQTKFYHIVAKVDQSILCHISDLVANPPETNKYSAVKTRLINRFEVSAQGKLEQLLGSFDMGDLRPTHLLAKMQELATGLNVNEELLKMLFLQRMPGSVKAILAISDGSLTKLAEMADKMVESSSSVSVVSTYSDQQKQQTVASTSKHPEGLSQSDLQEQIDLLSAEVRRLRTRSASRSRSASRLGNLSNSTEICWYHKKFGRNANTCRQPCRFSDSKN